MKPHRCKSARVYSGVERLSSRGTERVQCELIYPVATALGTETSGLLRRKARLTAMVAQRGRTNRTHVRPVSWGDRCRPRPRLEEGAINWWCRITAPTLLHLRGLKTRRNQFRRRQAGLLFEPGENHLLRRFDTWRRHRHARRCPRELVPEGRLMSLSGQSEN